MLLSPHRALSLASLPARTNETMARPLRLDYPGALWHVFSRGNAKMDLYLSDDDRQMFLGFLGETVIDFRWLMFEYCLMGNHYHLEFETSESNLSRGVHSLNARYAQWFNRKYGRCGHVFQGRFGARIVERESYLLALSRYVVLNPVRAGICSTAGEWPWSSYNATAGFIPSPRWLRSDLLLREFHRTDLAEAQRRYQEFVAAGCNNSNGVLGEISEEPYQGGRRFLEKLKPLIELKTPSVEFPKGQLHPIRPSVKEILSAVSEEFRVSIERICYSQREVARKAFAYIARKEGNCPLLPICRELGMQSRSVSNLIRSAEELLQSNDSFRSQVERAISRLRKVETMT